jgi:hypothetical protein
MGCHTWYRKPIVKGKENVQVYLRDRIKYYRKKGWLDDELEIEKILKAIDLLDENMGDELEELVNIDGDLRFINGEPIIFHNYEGDSDEPRIGGYPDTIITSSKQMFSVMLTGLISERGELCHFHIEPGREERVKELIITFFKKYPDEIIEFG